MTLSPTRGLSKDLHDDLYEDDGFENHSIESSIQEVEVFRPPSSNLFATVVSCALAPCQILARQKAKDARFAITMSKDKKAKDNKANDNAYTEGLDNN